jgi:hypothetical protein
MKPLSELPLFSSRPSPSFARTEPVYPEVPGYKAAGASQEAAAAMFGPAKTLRARALACIAQASDGLTADQVAAQLDASPFAIRPRVTELNRLGLIERSRTERRRNGSGMSAAVWKIAKPMGFEIKRDDRFDKGAAS